MSVPQEIEEGNTQIRSARLIVWCRWFYAPLIFLFAFFGKSDIGVLHALLILCGALIVVLLANAFFALYLQRNTSTAIDGKALTILSGIQIGSDVLFLFFIALFVGDNGNNVAALFFLLPIVISITVFDLGGALMVAMISGALFALSAFLRESPYLMLGAGDVIPLMTKELVAALARAGAVALFFLGMAFLGSRLFLFSRLRDKTLLEEITDVVHQLRTPLASIKWTLKYLLDGDGGGMNEEQRSLLTKSFALNEHAVSLVGEMLTIARLRSGKFVYHFVPVQFEKLIQEVIQDLLPIATAKRVRIEFHAPKDLPATWTMDPDKMRDVLQNLIDNGIKYSTEHGTVRVRANAQGRDLHLSVEDSGMGIPEKEKGKIFSQFFRAENAIATETEGSGLGLYIAHHVVARHNGKIWFESESGKGTIFHVILPSRQ